MTLDEQMGTLAGMLAVVALAVAVLAAGYWVLKLLMPYVIGLLLWMGVIE